MALISKIKKIQQGVLMLAKNPWLLNHILADDSRWWQEIKTNYNFQKPLPQVRLDTLFPDFSETLNCFSFLGGGSLPTDIALLTGLAQKIENCKYFEIGTWRGESVINVAEHAAESHTLNLSREEIEALGLPTAYATLHGYFSKENKKIQHHYGDSRHFDYAGLNQKFDLIFIDGDHRFDFVKNDTEKVFQFLTHENSIVVWHDYAYHPEKPRPEVFAGILAGLPKGLEKNLYHVENTMCAIYSPVELATQELITPVKPSHVFKVKIEQRSLNRDKNAITR